MRYLAVVALAIGLLSGRTLASSQVWGPTPASSWSPTQINALLNDSPWAGRASVQRAPYRRDYPKHKAVVTWESASLVRLARARSGHVFVNADPGGVPTYTVSVRLWGTAKALEPLPLYLRDPSQVYLKETALRRTGKSDLTPIRVDEFLVDKQGAVVPPIPMRDRMDLDSVVVLDACGHFTGRLPRPAIFDDQATPSVPRAGGDSVAGGYLVRGDLPCDTALVLVFDFPATDAIAAGERVEFTAMVGPQRITRTFQTSNMVVNGTADLR